MITIQVNDYINSYSRDIEIAHKMRCLVADGIRSFLNHWYPEFEHDVRVWIQPHYRQNEVRVFNCDSIDLVDKIKQDLFSEMCRLFNEALELERNSL